MSYILDALRKADRERSLGDVPDLEAAHWGVRRQDRSWRWLRVVGALLVINAALLVYMLNRSPKNPPPVPAARPAPAAVEPARKPLHARPVAEAPAVQQPVPVASGPALESVTAAAPEPAPGSSRVPQPEVPSAPVVAPTVLRPKVAVQPYLPEPREQPATGTTPGTSPRVVTAAEPLTDSPEPAVPGLPEWRDLPLDFRSHFTMPHIDVYVYDEDPQRRFILVGLKKYREGDTLPGGLVLEQILPGYLKLNYQGKEFRVDR
jgi:general secretion pathway protein B